jgi:hypothetical protein
MTRLSSFERLVESATLVARHPDFPDKPQAVEQCSQEVVELLQAGRITAPEAELLLDILENPSWFIGQVNDRPLKDTA